MLAQSSILAATETSLKTLFWCIGILEGRRTIGQDILESMIYESSTALKLASELLIDERIQKYMRKLKRKTWINNLPCYARAS